jgi:DNA-binding response OmpR family regulator
MKVIRPKTGPAVPLGPAFPHTLLLLSDDPAVEQLVFGIATQPWTLVCASLDRAARHQVFAHPNVRLVILDDEVIKESERSWLLTQISRHFSGRPLLYIAGRHSQCNEMRARANGAHYYASKPVSHAQFVRVLQSFLQTLQLK